MTQEKHICMSEPDFSDILKAGVTRFRQHVFPMRRKLFEKLAKAQNPKALFLTCADSRVVPSLITNTGPGDLFVERNPGNLVPIYREEAVGVSASIEYAVAVLRVEHIIICGHSDCGVVKGILHPDKVTQLPAVARWMEFGKPARDALLKEFCCLPEAEQIPILTEFNVLNQIDNLYTHPSVLQAVKDDRLTIHGWVYHIESGEVREYNAGSKRFETWPGARS
ncbi:MAG: carbonic anhydrase [Desulfuromonadales bacterium]